MALVPPPHPPPSGGGPSPPPSPPPPPSHPPLLCHQVYDRDYLKPDDMLGQLEFPVKTILTWTQVRPHFPRGACNILPYEPSLARALVAHERAVRRGPDPV